MRLLVTSLVLVAGLIACQSKPKSTWHGQMQEASELLSEILPDLVLGKWSDDGRERTRLRSLVGKLGEVSHGIDSNTGVPSANPSVKFVSRGFKKNLKEAQVDIDSGRWALAAAKVRRATNYCIACHTMNQASDSAYKLKLRPRLKGLTAFEKAKYFTAVRKFDDALVQYEYALNDKVWAKANPKLWNEGVLNLMAIIGRVKRNPNLILEMTSSLFDTDAYPKDLKAAARIWQQDARKWQKQTKLRLSLEKIPTYRGWALRDEKRIKNSGLIDMLRASADLNELLRLGKIPEKQMQRAFYYAGAIAKDLGERNFGGFAEDYFKLCLEKDKNSEFGKKCVRALAEL